MQAGDWVKLKIGNDWGVDYLAVNPLRNGAADQELRYKLKEGESIRVRLKGSIIREGVVKIRTKYGSVSDHGHAYAVTSMIPFVEFEEGTYTELHECEIPYDPAKDPSK